MTSEQLVERLRRRGHSMASGALFNPDGPEAARRIEADGAEITRLQEALAAAEAEHEKQISKLQTALAFWMPSITEAIEIELNGRAGDDAYLLAGFDGDVPNPSWGDKVISRAEAAEARIAETRKKALEEAATIAEATVDFHDDGLSTFDAAQIIAAAIRSLSAEEAKP